MWKLVINKNEKCLLVCPKGHYNDGTICFSCLGYIVKNGLKIQDSGNDLYPPNHLVTQYKLLCGE